MISQNIQSIIIKYLNHQANASEINQLEKWISNGSNEEIFKTYVKLNHLIDSNMKEFNTELSKKKLLEVIEKDKKVIKLNSFKRMASYAAAATVVLMISLTFVFKKDWFVRDEVPTVTPVVINNNIKPGSDKATLTLEDGSYVYLEKGQTFAAKNVSSNGHQLIYGTTEIENPKTKEIAYNTLTVPRGGEFYMVMADGTKVWLNSQTQLRYPVSFTKGEMRNVELLYGEAYFEVMPSSQFGGSSFKVINENQEIEVLGTKFNVKSYKEETNTYTTLVEGKVAVRAGGNSEILSPNLQSVLNKDTNKIQISTVKAKNEIAWINGEFILPHLNLKEIMQVLSRWYDMDVKFENKALEEERFVGIIRKHQNIEDILNNIKNLGILKDYEINDKTVILK